MISKTKIGKRIGRKANKEIVEVIKEAKKNEGWMKIAQKISGSNRKYSSVNLKEIELETKVGDTVLIAGKVLSSGKITKKIRVCALGFSDNAIEKLGEHKCEIVTILEEIKKNPKAEGIKVLA